MSDESRILEKLEVLTKAFAERFELEECKLVKTPDYYSILTSWFTLIHNINTNETSVKFLANLRPSTAAIVAQILGLVFPFGEYHVTGDYYPNAEGKAVFDDDAFYAYEEDRQAAFGKVRCYICDRFKDEEDLNAEGRCPVCATYKIEYH